ncbi:MAG: hypothetical protein OSB43_06625 [Nocardioides sp.]|uniref:hypothetical protein n=1 Tax=Nocardioides sp. TaxID=35761 RepID=UPI002389CE06|nr:hypothetical protein [Nocardioides sp.]MDE0775927.1 hypothetical protein [Nocardioides sp.]
MKRGHQLAHDSGKRTVTDRQQPRKSKRDTAEHADKYATTEEREMAEALAALVAHFNDPKDGTT